MFKDPCVGVMSRSGPPTVPGFMPPGSVRSYVVAWNSHDNIYWSELEPSQGSLSTAVLDHISDSLDGADSAGYSGGLKLRVVYGIHAPTWAKTTFGSSVVQTGVGVEDTCVLWWRPAALAAYDDLTMRLAAIFDGHPALRDVEILWPAIDDRSPFWRPTDETATSTAQTSAANLWAAFVAHKDDAGFVDSQGRRYYTDGATSEPYHGSQLRLAWADVAYRPDRHYGFVAADRAAIRAAVASHNRWWLKTRSSLAWEPYRQCLRGDDATIYGSVEDVAADGARPHRTWTLGAQAEFRDLMTQRLCVGGQNIRHSTIPSSSSQSDTFTRANSNWGDGWGTASGGGAYTGSATDSRIQNNYGEIRQNTAATERRIRHTASRCGVSRIDGLACWTVDAAGAEHWLGVELNVQDVAGTADGYYQIRITQQTSGDVDVRWWKDDSTVGSATAVGPSVPVLSSVTAETWLHIRAEVELSGSESCWLRAKVWKVGTGEPDQWTVEVEDLTPDLANWDGHLGWRTNTGAAYTATANVWRLDDWTLTTAGQIQPGEHVGGPGASGRFDAVYQAQAEAMSGPNWFRIAEASELPAEKWREVLDWCSTSRDEATPLGQHGQNSSYIELADGYELWTP